MLQPQLHIEELPFESNLRVDLVWTTRTHESSDHQMVPSIGCKLGGHLAISAERLINFEITIASPIQVPRVQRRLTQVNCIVRCRKVRSPSFK